MSPSFQKRLKSKLSRWKSLLLPPKTKCSTPQLIVPLLHLCLKVEDSCTMFQWPPNTPEAPAPILYIETPCAHSSSARHPTGLEQQPCYYCLSVWHLQGCNFIFVLQVKDEKNIQEMFDLSDYEKCEELRKSKSRSKKNHSKFTLAHSRQPGNTVCFALKHTVSPRKPLALGAGQAASQLPSPGLRFDRVTGGWNWIAWVV